MIVLLLLYCYRAKGEFAMYKFTKSVFINRSQQDIFDFTTNPANNTKWQPIDFGEWTSTGVPGIGSTYKIVMKLWGRRYETLFEITSWDPPNRYSYRSIKVQNPLESIEAVITLAPKENGTQLTFKAQIGAAGLFKIVEGMLGKMAEKGDGNNFDTLKRILEAS
jgi:hypothetical protein